MEEWKFYMSMIQTGSSITILGIVLYVFFNFYQRKDEKNDTATKERENKLLDKYYESNQQFFEELKERDLHSQEFIKNLLERMDLYNHQLTLLISKIETNQFCPLMNSNNKKREGGTNA